MGISPAGNQTDNEPIRNPARRNARLRKVSRGKQARLLTLTHPRNALIYHVYPQRVEQYGSNVASSIIDVMMNLTLLWWAYNGLVTGTEDG